MSIIFIECYDIHMQLTYEFFETCHRITTISLLFGMYGQVATWSYGNRSQDSIMIFDYIMADQKLPECHSDPAVFYREKNFIPRNHIRNLQLVG